MLEGDVQGSLDADRLASLHIPVVQLNTGAGFGGECHLDANMVRSALPQIPLDEIDLLIIENVGNLVCPAEFRVGEDVRIMVSSVAEGEDKPLKYPLMFRACELVVVNKLDLLPHVDFDMDRYLHHLDAVHPGVERMLMSARTGEGMEQFRHMAGAGTGDEPPRRPEEGGRRGLLRRGGGADRPPLPRDVRALRRRRPADRGRLDAGRALRRAARRGGVRAPGDRRQARAAGHRAGGGGRAAGGPDRADRRARRHLHAVRPGARGAAARR